MTALEDTILLTAPGVEGAMIASITIGSIDSDPGTLPIGIAAGLAADLVVSVFVLAWVYGAVGIALSWVVKILDEPHQAWWPSEFQPGQSTRK